MLGLDLMKNAPSLDPPMSTPELTDLSSKNRMADSHPRSSKKYALEMNGNEFI